MKELRFGRIGKQLALAFALAGVTFAAAARPPHNPTSCELYDADSDPTNPYYANVNSNGSLDVNVLTSASPGPSTSPCKTIAVNSQGVANADITVDATAGGVSVLAASATRCGAVVVNVGTADMRCGPTSMTVSATAGFLIQAGGKLALDLEGQQAMKCIRTTGTSTTASVAEATP